ncbi:hypothetical protein CFB44_28945 [Burkholderia sp. AU31280]|nr:hypothetical protein CFB44_28945 [Burkholderia sp. AU31280]
MPRCTLNARSGESRYHERRVARCSPATHTRSGGAAGRHATDEARGGHPRGGRPRGGHPRALTDQPLRPRRFVPGIHNNRTGVHHT